MLLAALVLAVPQPSHRTAPTRHSVAQPSLRSAPILALATPVEIDASRLARLKREGVSTVQFLHTRQTWLHKLEEPTWTDLTQIPIRVHDKAAWLRIPFPKRLAAMCRLSVVHLTVLSAAAPGILAASTGRGVPHGAALGWLCTVTLALWHLSHNMINDAQDLDDDKLRTADKGSSFRLAYGTHPLAQGFLPLKEFRLVLSCLMAAAAAGSFAIAELAPACAWAFPLGTLATVAYTPLAKPLGLGELLTYFVWGPVIFGGGWAVATGAVTLADALVLSAPFGLGAFALIFGKHIDKLDDRTAHGLGTLPALLGQRGARALAATALAGQHVATLLLVCTRLFPPGAILAPLMCAAYELPKALSVLTADRPEAKPPASLAFTGSMGVSLRPGRTWPLWYATSAGWHAVTFGYWLLAGLLLSWAARPFGFKAEAAALAVLCAAQAARYILGAAGRRR